MVFNRAAEVRSRTSVRTPNLWTEPKVQVQSGSVLSSWGRFSLRFWPWDVGLNRFEPTSVIGCSKILKISNLLQKWKKCWEKISPWKFSRPPPDRIRLHHLSWRQLHRLHSLPACCIQELPEVDYHMLKGEQQNVFLQVMAYLKKLKTGENDQPETLQLNVDSTASTTTALRKLFSEETITYDPVVHLAPTGVAAFDIHGWTINFGLMIPVKEGFEFNQLGQSILACFQTWWKEIELLILDEKSMVGITSGSNGPSPAPGSSSKCWWDIW